MTKRISTAQAATLVFDTYASNLDTLVTGRAMIALTGLTEAQFNRAKAHLRDVVAGDEHFMYVSRTGRNGGSCLTRRPEDAREYMRNRAKVITTQLGRIKSGTLRELDQRDPSAALISKQVDRLIEDLQFVGEVA